MSDQPKVGCSCGDDGEKAIARQLGRGILGGLLIVLVMALTSPLIYGKAGDTYGFFRTIFETAGPVMIKGTLGLILWSRLEYGLKWNWTRRIYDATYGPAIMFAVFLLCVLR